MPPIASMNLGKLAKLTTIRWLILTPGELLDRLDRQRRAAERVGGVDLACAPWPGMSATVSRGIDSRREVPPPIRHSMIVSERLPASLRVGARLLGARRARWSVPMISTVSVEVSMLPPELSAAEAEAGTLPVSIWALIRNSTSESSSQATIASATYLSTRPGGDPAGPARPVAAGRAGRRRRILGPAGPGAAETGRLLLAAQARAQALGAAR